MAGGHICTSRNVQNRTGIEKVLKMKHFCKAESFRCCSGSFSGSGTGNDVAPGRENDGASAPTHFL
jgi:hypothetical protein